MFFLADAGEDVEEILTDIAKKAVIDLPQITIYHCVGSVAIIQFLSSSYLRSAMGLDVKSLHTS